MISEIQLSIQTKRGYIVWVITGGLKWIQMEIKFGDGILEGIM